MQTPISQRGPSGTARPAPRPTPLREAVPAVTDPAFTQLVGTPNSTITPDGRVVSTYDPNFDYRSQLAIDDPSNDYGGTRIDDLLDGGYMALDTDPNTGQTRTVKVGRDGRVSYSLGDQMYNTGKERSDTWTGNYNWDTDSLDDRGIQEALKCNNHQCLAGRPVALELMLAAAAVDLVGRRLGLGRGAPDRSQLTAFIQQQGNVPAHVALQRMSDTFFGGDAAAARAALSGQGGAPPGGVPVRPGQGPRGPMMPGPGTGIGPQGWVRTQDMGITTGGPSGTVSWTGRHAWVSGRRAGVPTAQPRPVPMATPAAYRHQLHCPTQVPVVAGRGAFQAWGRAAFPFRRMLAVARAVVFPTV